jgi:hypothetical protein
VSVTGPARDFVRGDVNGDGKPDIITGAGAGGGPQVSVFSGVDLRLLEAFMAYSPYFNGGVRVGYALDQDGHGDILIAAGSGGGPHVQVLDGLSLTAMDSSSPTIRHSTEASSSEASRFLLPGGTFAGTRSRPARRDLHKLDRRSQSGTARTGIFRPGGSRLTRSCGTRACKRGCE